MKITIPDYYSWHSDNGKPAAIITDGKIVPDLRTGWIVVFHPTQELIVDEQKIAAELMTGTAHVGKAVFDKYIKKGSKLSLKQRLRGRA